ncbi:haloalkane dehalogenase [Halomarina rubra]|uniref:Haloalkane dehalogenase n=1 Tax=Halomarina rubra TaxID=2071873 RepID=A0ABD6AZQ0_9EURY|nr:haloalkane dehalogenase [Halomarina rubra]
MGRTSTPADRFTDLPDFDYERHSVTVGDSEARSAAGSRTESGDGIEMAYVDEGEGTETFLCLHGEPTWGYLYRKMIPTLAERGRVVVPDFVGFGRSEKLTDREDYSFDLHYETLAEFVEKLDLQNVTLVCQDWGGIVGLTYAAHEPDRFARLVAMNTFVPTYDTEMADEWYDFRNFVERVEELPIGMLIQNATATELSDEELAAYEAPYPDEASKAGAYAWPDMVPRTDGGDAGEGEKTAAAREKLKEWEKPAFVLFADSDPITKPARDPLRGLIGSADEQPDVWVEGAMHFLQEDAGEEIAEEILAFVDRT